MKFVVAHIRSIDKTVVKITQVTYNFWRDSEVRIWCKNIT